MPVTLKGQKVKYLSSTGNFYTFFDEKLLNCYIYQVKSCHLLENCAINSSQQKKKNMQIIAI